MRCIIDCRVDDSLKNNFMELSLWGKPCFAYVVESTKESDCFSKIELITDSEQIENYCNTHYEDILLVRKVADSGEPVFHISGRAPCISSTTIRNAVDLAKEKAIISSRETADYCFNSDRISFYNGTEQRAFNAFRAQTGVLMDDRKYAFYPVPDNEAVVINSANDFELALVLKKKQENRPFVLQTIDRIIKEKTSVFAESFNGKSVCFIGHSQLDQWKIEELFGYKVRNCAVSGISSFEYNEKIIEKDLLNCDTDVFIVMHGTNDVVWDYTIDEMVESINRNVDYLISCNPSALIIFMACIHVNGRLDRSNTRIDELNKTLKAQLKDKVFWLNTSFMDDKYGCLDERYTKDGLHLSETGYSLLKEKTEETMKRLGL